MSQLKIFLFGRPRLVRNRETVHLDGRKVLALAAYLAMTIQPQSRDHLAALLWPEYGQSSARANLRRELSRLHSILNHDHLLVEREQVGLRRDQELWLDIAVFQACIDHCQRHAHDTHEVCDDCLHQLADAVALYTADFLMGFSLPDSPAFDEWQYFQAETLRQALAGALEQLVRGYRARHQYELAIAYARRWLALDLLNEPVHRQLMGLYAHAGQRAAALRQYEVCKRSLQEELNALPTAETQRLYEAIRTQRFPGEQQVVAPLAPQPVIALPPFLAEQPAAVTRPAVFVGRARELAKLTATLETARSGKGQVLFVIGGAGRGKTMLVHEFARIAQQEDPTLLAVSGHCNAHTGIGDPYLPFREVLAMLASDVEAKWASGSLSTQSARRLWEAMPITLPALLEHASDLIGPFLPAKALHSYATANALLDARWVQQLAQLADKDLHLPLEERRLFAQSTAALKAVAARRPLLLILEDLHWVDEASSSLLFHLSREIGNSPILMVGTYRPDELVGQGQARHPLLSITTELKRQYGDIWLDLGDLTPVESRHFVDAYLDTQPNRLGEAFRTAFFHHTGGQALFAVELLREMQERGDVYLDGEGYWVEGSTIDWHTLPVKVEGIIEKRIERLDEELQALLTVASVEGEVFTAEVVACVQQGPERELVQHLSRALDRQYRLVTAEALHQIGGQRLSRYRFRHSLFQHYLYHRLDAAERAYLHEAVGRALEGLYGEQTDQVAVQLAHHYEQAGVTDRAVTYLLQAGEQAQRLSANQEAVQHLTQGLALLANLPAPQRASHELALQITLGHALAALKGRGAPETGQAYQRAHELGLHSGEPAQRFAALHGLYAYHLSRAELQTARAVTQQLLHLAKNQPDPILRVSAHRALGNTLTHLGEFAAAREQLEQGIMLYQGQDHPSYVRLCGQDDGVVSLAILAYVLWFLGYPDQAQQRGDEALTLAQTVAHPVTLTLTLMFLTALQLSRRDGQRAQQHAEALISVAAEQGFTDRAAQGVSHRGMALVMQGKEEGVVEIQRGLNASQATGFDLLKPYYLTSLAEWYAQSGQTEQGLNLLAEGLAVLEQSDKRTGESEMYRLQGELLVMRHRCQARIPAGHFAEGEACFRQAIEIAQRQQAKSCELRATTSLCRLWQAQGKAAAAYALLAEVYGWFTEGFDTVDLQEAKALLDELQGAALAE
jgi:DNA-binding SARP family transcriptional activator